MTPKLASRVLRPGRVRTIGPEMPTGRFEPLFDAMSRRRPEGAGSLAMRLINSAVASFKAARALLPSLLWSENIFDFPYRSCQPWVCFESMR